MEIRTLRDSDTDQVLIAFNEAFSGYFVPLQLTKEQLLNKIRSEGIDLGYSTGAFLNGRLSGFILHAIDLIDNKKTVYNGGTGVIPGQRSKGLTQRMYDFILPVLIAEKVDNVILEVIAENMAAIKTYEKIGFKIKRKLACYKGESRAERNDGLIIKELREYDWDKLKTFWDFTPAWQNSENVVERQKDNNISYGAFIDDKLAGYIVYNPLSKRVQQFAVDKHHRRKKIASGLFACISQPGTSLSLINVDEYSVGTDRFLKQIGLEKFLEQYEMQLSTEICEEQS
jgi:ribosomal protein S18 acetylase RimI-like enzyme